ncbi:metal ABC transporter permease [Paenibacillus doosanensis]|uniref:metal ABC transporter permease n=1 Tax=Paenibacillus doosanensis TaxID=1229154 RepID=UPI00217FE6BD|nr:metal ABC transporter permease [Paenibacillus doosanensis]MCS7464961.1 metal ABC transporter permease [Paenibacillus doosanensis]
MEMLHYEFMQRAFLAGGIVSLLASVLGVYLMLRRQALMADTLSHVSLAGVALGSLLRLNPVVTAFLVAIVGACAVEYVRRSFRSFSEISIAIIMIGGLASSVVIMNMSQGLSKSMNAYLFGSIVAVSGGELWLMLAVAVIGGLYFCLLRRPLYVLAFDEETAETSGLKVKLLSLSFSIMTGMAVAVAMPIVGVLLVSSLVVLPAALAIRIARSFAGAIWIAMAAGLTGVYTGLTASYKLNTPPGGTIALTLLAFLIGGLLVKRGWLYIGKLRNRNVPLQEEKIGSASSGELTHAPSRGMQ